MPLGYRTISGRPISAILARYGEKAFVALGAALYAEAQGILAQSQPLVPVDTGALRSSGYVSPPARFGRMIRVEIGYGGPATKINPKTGQPTSIYALKVHEDLNAFHKVGIAKFLELPFTMAQKGMTARIAAAMQASLRTGKK